MMKKLFIPIFLLAFATSFAQVPVDTADLRAKINSWIVPNGSKQITAVQINQLFNGVANLMKSYSVDSAYRINDTLFLSRRGGYPTIKVKLNTGGASSETDPTVPTVAKSLTGSDTARWNNKLDPFIVGSGLALYNNVLFAASGTAMWNASHLQGNAIKYASPLMGQVLKWNGIAWQPSNDSVGSGGSADSLIYVTGYRADSVKANIRSEIEKIKPESILGSLYKSNNFTSLSGFSTNGVLAVARGGHIHVSGGAPLTASIDLDSSHAIEQWAVDVILDSITSGNGPGVGFRSNTISSAYGIMLQITPGTGILTLYVGSMSGAVKTSSTGVPNSSNDKLLVSVEFDKTRLMFKVRNLTTNSKAVTLDYNYDFVNTSGGVTILPNTGKFAVFNNGGGTEFNIDSFAVFSKVPKYPCIVLVGDSKFRGYTVTGEGYRLVDLLNVIFRSAVTLSGGNDRLEDIIRRYKEIVLVAGTRGTVILGGCSNNIRYGQSSSEYLHLYDTLTTLLVNAGVKVIHTTGFREPGIDQSIFRAHIISTYPLDYIETLYATSEPGFLAEDSIHLNDNANSAVADYIVKSQKVTGAGQQFNPGNTVVNNQYKFLQPANFNIAGIGGIYGNDNKARLTITNKGTLSRFINFNIDDASNASYVAWQRQGVDKAFIGLNGSGNGFVIRNENDHLYFQGNSGVEKARLTSDGDFLINTTTSPFSNSYKLNVSQGPSKAFIANYNGTAPNGSVISGSQDGEVTWFIGNGSVLTPGADIGDITFRPQSGVLNISDNNGNRLLTVRPDSVSAPHKLSYESNLHGSFTRFSLIDKALLDSIQALNVRRLKSFINVANNTSTTESDLYSYTLPANTLANDSSGLTFEISGTYNDVTATNQLRFYWGAADLFNTGGITISGSGGWNVKAAITRTSSTSITASFVFTTSNASTNTIVNVVTSGGKDFTTTNTLKITGTASGAGGGSNDITAMQGIVTLIP